MPRIWIVLAFAFVIFWQSSCLQFRDGMIINRCGLWQKVTGGAVVLAMREPKDRVQEIIREIKLPVPSAPINVPSTTSTPNISGPVIIYQDRPVYQPPMITMSPNSMQYYSGATTITTMSISPDEYSNRYRYGR